MAGMVPTVVPPPLQSANALLSRSRGLCAGAGSEVFTIGWSVAVPDGDGPPHRCWCGGPSDAGGPASGHLLILVTRPAPTVREPSRIANFRPSSMAIGWMSSTDMSVLSPGMTISVPSGRCTTPVTSVVRK